MAIDKSMWFPGVFRNEVPAYPCPSCGKRTLILDDKTLAIQETEASKAGRKHDEWEPDWTEERFICLFRCSSIKCGEIVAASGRVSVEPTFDDEGGWNYERALEPRSMYPPPPIITMPAGVPASVK